MTGTGSCFNSPNGIGIGIGNGIGIIYKKKKKNSVQSEEPCADWGVEWMTCFLVLWKLGGASCFICDDLSLTNEKPISLYEFFWVMSHC